MPLSLNEIPTRAAAFSRKWADTFDENVESKSFWDGFFRVFGQERWQVVSFNERERIEYLFGLYEKYTSGLLIVEVKEKGRKA